jgi:hypothetical protein
MDRNELPLERRHLGVPSGASKMIPDLMLPSAQTMLLSCTDTNTVSKHTKTRFQITHVSMKYGRQSTEGYTHDGRLISRGAHNQEPDGNRDTRHKIYTGSGHQREVKPYILCSVILC